MISPFVYIMSFPRDTKKKMKDCRTIVKKFVFYRFFVPSTPTCTNEVSGNLTSWSSESYVQTQLIPYVVFYKYVDVKAEYSAIPFAFAFLNGSSAMTRFDALPGYYRFIFLHLEPR